MQQSVLEQIHNMYCLAYEKCQKARRAGAEYIGFRRHGDGYQLIISHTNNGRSSARMGLSVADWACNVLYRLQDCGFIDSDWSLDEYFETLNKTGYDYIKGLE